MRQITVIGMTCEHCVSAVTNTLKDLGLSDVSVDLVSGKATFAATQAVTEAQVSEAIMDAGFDVSAVS